MHKKALKIIFKCSFYMSQ